MSIQEQGVSASSASSSRRFLIVTISERYVALDAGSVEGVLTSAELGNSEDPTTQGLVDRTVSLVMQLGSADVPTHPTTRVVLLTDRGMRGSIRVSDVHGVLEIQQAQILPLPPQFSGVERHWYRGMILFEKSIAMILNLTWVLEVHGGLDQGQDRETPRTSVDAWAIGVSDGRTC
ncbi:MAG: chemotaxis protein CheW [Nitrospira sp.]|nr:chemotaxis protein CheW [Nitrospira sp.]MDH4368751.1 chemotaxis protein CheW [Nitrospira sp.]MDH5346465.1 chemotaxis protein CheW [Nitrospira sp.]MDH5498573.1 chemotaxis protein CheW [Nitrospira sp.]MDH5726253.1 chemotaxis protein CheW [Nitrospira sp.]